MKLSEQEVLELGHACEVNHDRIAEDTKDFEPNRIIPVQTLVITTTNRYFKLTIEGYRKRRLFRTKYYAITYNDMPFRDIQELDNDEYLDYYNSIRDGLREG